MNAIRIFALVLSTLAYFVGACDVHAQGKAKGTQTTAFLTCWDENSKNYGSRSARGPVLISPNGLHEAYAKAEAFAQRSADSGGQETCKNKSTLFVGRGGKAQFDSVYVYQGATGEAQGNGIQLIDWSADSRILVADLLTWYYFSEGWEHNILTYSTRTGSVEKKSLNELFSAALHKDCHVEAQLKGFLRDGRVALRVIPLDEEEGPSCVDQEGMWALDISSFKVSPLAQPEPIKQNGRFGKSN